MTEYQTPEELLEGEAYLVKTLEVAGLKPDFILHRLKTVGESPYTARQLGDLFGKVRKEEIDKLLTVRESDRKSEYSNGRTEPLSPMNPVHMIDVMRELGRTTQVEGFDMMLLMRYDALQEYASAARAVLEIPPEGLSLDGWVEHFGKMDEKVGAFLSEKVRIGLCYNALLAGVDRFVQNQTVFGGAEPGRGFLIDRMIFDYIVFNNPFVFAPTIDNGLSAMRGNEKPEQLTAVRPRGGSRLINDSIDLVIAIYPTTTKDEVKAAIDHHWGDLDVLRGDLPALPSRKRVKDDATALKMTFQVYDAYMRGKNYKQISADFGVGEARARRMVSDVKKRIRELTKVVPVS